MNIHSVSVYTSGEGKAILELSQTGEISVPRLNYTLAEAQELAAALEHALHRARSLKSAPPVSIPVEGPTRREEL